MSSVTAIYARQSVDKKDSISIESQIERCKTEFDGDYVVFQDRGYSGKNVQRPAFRQMYDELKRGAFERVVVYRLDRISRSLLDFAEMIETFNKHNVKFVSSQEKFDTDSPIGRAMLSVIMIFAQLERETIQQRIRDNYYDRGKRGMYLGGPAPYGFEKHPYSLEGTKTSILTPKYPEIETVKRIYAEYAGFGASLTSIARSLSKEGVLSPGGKTWNSLMVARILKSPAYVRADADIFVYYSSRGVTITAVISEFTGTNGCYLYGKRDRNAAKYTDMTDHVLSIAPHEGVVDSSLWLMCQTKLNSNQQVKNTGKGRHTWLSGLCKCARCGYSLKVAVYNHVRYFICSGKYNANACDGFSRTIYLDDIEPLVEAEILRRIGLFANDAGSSPEETTPAKNKLKLRLLEIDAQIGNLVRALAEGRGVSLAYIEKHIADLDGERQSVLSSIERLARPVRTLPGSSFSWPDSDMDEKKRIANLMIHRVDVSEDALNIEWAFNG